MSGEPNPGDVDGLRRENAHLRIIAQKVGCPYGHMREGGCELGYPGCACMDDLLAMTAWCPEDEEKAAVRLGKRVRQLEGERDAAEARAEAAERERDEAREELRKLERDFQEPCDAHDEKAIRLSTAQARVRPLLATIEAMVAEYNRDECCDQIAINRLIEIAGDQAKAARQALSLDPTASGDKEASHPVLLGADTPSQTSGEAK